MGRRQRSKGKERGKGTPRSSRGRRCKHCGNGLSKTRLAAQQDICANCEVCKSTT